MSIRMESLEGAGEFNLNITICELSWRIIYNRDNHGNSAAAGSHVQGGSLILCYLWQRTSFLNFILIFHTMWTAWENVWHSFCKKLHYNYPPHISGTVGWPGNQPSGLHNGLSNMMAVPPSNNQTAVYKSNEIWSSYFPQPLPVGPTQIISTYLH